MKKYKNQITLFLLAVILGACSNLPQTPTKTPTMSAEELMQAAQETADALRRETETQWAIDNPSPTPTDTATPAPPATATSAIPLIPPTATEAPRPYYSISDTNYKVFEIGNPSNWSDFVPMSNIFIEVCFKNAGSAIWNENYFCKVTNPNGTVVQPLDGVKLGHNTSYDEWACFDFSRQGDPNTALRTYCPGFQLYSDTGTSLARGYTTACFTIH